MKTATVFWITCFVCVCAGGPSFARVAPGQYYTQLFVGGTVANDAEFETRAPEVGDLDSGYAIGGAFGYGLREGILDCLVSLRTEVEVSHRRANLEAPTKDSEAGLTTVFANGWIDLGSTSRIVPYVGGGVGVGIYEPDTNSERGLAFQVGGGANYVVSKSVFLGMNYRYVRSQFDDRGQDGRLSGHQITANIGIPLTKF